MGEGMIEDENWSTCFFRMRYTELHRPRPQIRHRVSRLDDLFQRQKLRIRPLLHFALPFTSCTPALDILDNHLDLLYHRVDGNLITNNDNRPTALWLPNGDNNHKARTLENIPRLPDNLINKVRIPVVTVNVRIHPVLHNGADGLLAFKLCNLE